MDDDGRNNKETPLVNKRAAAIDTPIPATALVSLASSCATSSASIADTNGEPSSSTMTTTIQRHDEETTASLQQSILEQQLIVVGVLAATSFGALLVLVLPISALMALGMCVSSVCVFFYLLSRMILLEWRNVVQGRGIGDLLPQFVYDQLTGTSLNEWLSDVTLYLEWRFLLLYFIPGISQEQLEAYLERLPLRHQQILNRPGLGQFFGEDFMRIIMGESRWNLPPADPQRQDLATEHASRRLVFEPDDDDDDDDDEHISVGLDVTEPDTIGASTPGLALPQASSSPTPMAHSPRMVVPSRDDESSQDIQRDYDEEGAILTDAVSAATATYSSMAAEWASGRVLDSVIYVSPIVIGTGAMLTTGAVGIGVWGWWLGVYHPSRIITRPASPHYFPTFSTLMSTALVGGASVTFMMMFRSAIRWNIQKERLLIDIGSSQEDDKRKDKTE